jgi:hypothetical protein
MKSLLLGLGEWVLQITDYALIILSVTLAILPLIFVGVGFYFLFSGMWNELIGISIFGLFLSGKRK